MIDKAFIGFIGGGLLGGALGGNLLWLFIAGGLGVLFMGLREKYQW